MTDISMDPAVMKLHAEMHDEVRDEAKTALGGTPNSIDGGLGANSVAMIVSKLVTHVDAVYRVHGTLGEIVRSIPTTRPRPKRRSPRASPISRPKWRTTNDRHRHLRARHSHADSRCCRVARSRIQDRTGV